MTSATVSPLGEVWARQAALIMRTPKMAAMIRRAGVEIPLGWRSFMGRSQSGNVGLRANGGRGIVEGPAPVKMRSFQVRGLDSVNLRKSAKKRRKKNRPG